MSFAEFLAWLVTSGIAGIVLVALQGIVKWAGFDPEAVSQRVVAIVLAVLAGLVVYVFKFVFGIQGLFPEITDLWTLVQTIVTWLSIGQVAYNVVWKPVKARYLVA